MSPISDSIIINGAMRTRERPKPTWIEARDLMETVIHRVE